MGQIRRPRAHPSCIVQATFRPLTVVALIWFRSEKRWAEKSLWCRSQCQVPWRVEQPVLRDLVAGTARAGPEHDGEGADAGEQASR